MTYPASHILMRDETAAQCRARKLTAIATAERLMAKAQPLIACYWQAVKQMAQHDLTRLEELP